MFLFFLLFCLNYSASVIYSATEFNKIIDESTIIISLENYNVSTPEGESIDSFFMLPPQSRSKIVLMKIPSEVHFVVLQVHSYLFNVTLAHDALPLQNNSIQGTNVGLLKIYQKMDLSFYLTYNSSLTDLDVMVSVQAYSAEAPVPGGCNMEFPVEVSPFLLTTYNDVTTDVNFAPSAPPLSVLRRPFLGPGNECNIKPSPVHHKMYHRYFPESDFSKETYFNILKSLMTKGRILENGYLVPEKLTGSSMKRIFATYPGTGNAFVVITLFENRTAVYVPSFSYGCIDLNDDNTCLVLRLQEFSLLDEMNNNFMKCINGIQMIKPVLRYFDIATTFSKVLCATVFFLGLFNCFFGHYFFRIEIFLFGFLASGIVTYILVSILFTNSIALSVAVSVGLFIAALKLVAWAIFGLPIISVTLTTLIFGFVLASLIFYPIIDFVDLLVLDINFWGIFIGIVLTCPILMIYLAEKANIVSCAFVGSYVAIMSIDHYVGSNLRYIIINTIRRAVVDNFRLAIIGPPFQLKDALLCFVWIILIFLGVAVQKGLTRNKPPYPPPVNPLKNVFKRWKKPSSYVNRPNERTPLSTSFPATVSPTLTSSHYTDYDGN